MAVTTFVALSAVWLMGFSYCTFACARLEGDADPGGPLGAMVGMGWLRGTSPASRRWRSRALSFGAAGLMVIILVTRAVIRYETGA